MMLTKRQPQIQPAWTGPSCFKLQCSTCWGNSRGILSNNCRAHRKVANAIPSIYTKIPQMWRNDLLLLSGINRTPCCCLHCAATLYFSLRSRAQHEPPAGHGLFWQHHLMHQGAALAVELLESSLRVLLSYSCHETCTVTKKFTRN